MSIQSITSFGDVAAEDDAVLSYFLSTNAVETVAGNRALVVLGRKGTGKTALVRYFTERPSLGLSKSVNLRGYPWLVHAKRRDMGASDIETYVSSWRYLIAVELASLVLSQPHVKSSHCSGRLSQFLRDNYGGTEPTISEILRPKRLQLTKLSISPAVMGNQLGGVDLDRDPSDHRLGLELNAISTALLDSVAEIVSDVRLGPLSVHFDELDQGLSKFDSNRQSMLIGLVIAAREIRRESLKRQIIINPVVYLRTDLWDDLQFSDKNKITQTDSLSFHLAWNGDSLKDLIETRLQTLINSQASWNTITSHDLMRGSQTKWNHILARTFLRPRDVIRFCNATLAQAKRREEGESVFLNEDIVNSRNEYSAYLKAELDDEVRPHWAHWDEALQACSALATLTFEKSDFAREYDRRRSKENSVTSQEALGLLHRFSVIGYERRSGYGGTSWAFQYTDPEAGWDSAATRFKVHLGLKEYAKLREERSVQ